ncbi:MAG TPA: universal stress protein [Pirellulales bacterium]|nr:universal stress protein [Pirellulales bacterium]
MSQFRNVLVGIDLLQARDAGSTSFSPPVEEAIKHGLWLAERASASVTFFASVEVPEDDLYSLTDEQGVAGQIRQLGRRALDDLVQRAKDRGLVADAKLVAGEGWVEIIREVLHGGHDLVVVGTRNVGAIQRFLFGSTAMRLLHNCPCPVWVTRPEPRPLPTNILAASDFSEVSDEALRLSLRIGELSGAKVNLVHAVDLPLDRLWSTGLLDTSTQMYHDRVKADARQRLTEQLHRVAGESGPSNVELHVVEGLSIADTAILDFVQHHHVDLLVMGTMARSGIPGVFIGNTAERLVTHLCCSLLAVKPAHFVSPLAGTSAGHPHAK